MNWIDFLSRLHAVGWPVLLGGGAGIACFLFVAHRTRDPDLIAHVAGSAGLASLVLSAIAVIALPLTGYILMRSGELDFSDFRIRAILALHVFAGGFWLPVVFLSMKLRKIASECARKNRPLPEAYDRLFRLWFISGGGACLCMLAIIWLMPGKPTGP